jgi:hypothetical protein
MSAAAALLSRHRAAAVGAGGPSGGRSVPAPAFPRACLPRYQRYLESVLEASDDYQEVGDLLARHATLQATNADLREVLARTAATAEATRAELQVRAGPAVRLHAAGRGLGRKGLGRKGEPAVCNWPGPG